MSSQLYGIQPNDPWIAVSTVALLAVVAVMVVSWMLGEVLRQRKK